MTAAARQPERCDICRFDASAYTLDDVIGTLRSIMPWWQMLTAGIDDATLHARPDPTTWSAVEYAAHSAFITGMHAAGLMVLAEQEELVIEEESVALGAIDTEPSARATADVLRELDDAVAALRDIAPRITGEVAHHRLVVRGPDGDDVGDAAYLLRHGVHDALHHLHDVGRGLHALGAGVPTQHGRVVQLNVGAGGVPKTSVAAVEVRSRGVVGDRQRERRHHGRVWQALCLYSEEVIDTLRAEGHPIHPGAAGENVTIAGIDWASLRPGTRVRIGTVEAELSVPALPCAKNAQWFVGGDFKRMHHERDWGATRWYASVMVDGSVRVGDPVIVEP